MRLLATTLALVCSLASRASAQGDGPWVIIPSTSGSDDGWVEPTVERVRTELIEQGVQVWTDDRASKRFEIKASSPPADVDEAALQRWSELSDGAVRDLALGENEEALQKLEEAHDLMQRAIEELNRDPERAQKALDTCLYRVRAILAAGSRSRAWELARECRKLVPRGEPSPYMHPPAVTEVLREVDELRTRQSGALQVRSIPSGCTARLNGVLLGETPVEIEQLFSGRYRLQVECDVEQRGRVHTVSIGAGRTVITVDSRFDDAIETRPALALHYENAADERAHRLSDARRIGRELSAARVVIASKPSEGTLELALIDATAVSRRGSLAQRSMSDATQRPLALARIHADPSGPSRDDVALAAGTLTEGRCVDFTSAKPVVLACEDQQPLEVAEAPAPPLTRPADRRPRGQFIAGMTLIGVGLSGLVTGYALLIPRASAAEDWYADVDQGGDGVDSQQRWINLRSGIVASASVGAGSLVAAMPLALPERAKTPWWAWLSGGVGVGLAAFSIAYGVTADAEPSVSCGGQQATTDGVASCVKRGEQTSLAVLTGLTAAPLITMPLVYLFRPSKAKLEPSAQIGRSGAYLSLSGRF